MMLPDGNQRGRRGSFYPTPPPPSSKPSTLPTLNPNPNLVTPLPTSSPSNAKNFKVGVADTIGRRAEMQDFTLVQETFRLPDESLFVVFDGHNGRDAGLYAVENVSAVLKTHIEQTPKDIPAALSATFRYLHQQMLDKNLKAGATACVALLVKRTLYVANAGDTRAVLCREGKPLRLSVDHKPSLPEEKARIESLGGSVIDNKLNGILAVSRALGDPTLHPYVYPEPYISTTELTSEDKFLVIASDGLWDIFSDELAVQNVKSETGTPEEAAIKLRDRAYAAGSTDNISIIVVNF